MDFEFDRFVFERVLNEGEFGIEGKPVEGPTNCRPCHSHPRLARESEVP
jgi:hypothetical protein